MIGSRAYANFQQILAGSFLKSGKMLDEGLSLIALELEFTKQGHVIPATGVAGRTWRLVPVVANLRLFGLSIRAFHHRRTRPTSLTAIPGTRTDRRSDRPFPSRQWAF